MTEPERIFILDDDVFILSLYRDMFENLGYKVFATTNAYQFLLYAKEIVPAIFILDINMPELTGWEVMRRLAKEEILAGIPVVMMSVLADRALAAEKGAAHYLTKPVKPEMLTEIVEAYCRGNKNHDVLLVEDYEPMQIPVKDKIIEKGWSCFEVNALRAAQSYLDKNTPKVVVVNLPGNLFAEAQKKLQHPKIYHLKSYEQIDEIEDLLK